MTDGTGTIKHIQEAAITHNRVLIASLRQKDGSNGKMVPGSSFTSGGRYEDLLEQSAREIEALQE